MRSSALPHPAATPSPPLSPTGRRWFALACGVFAVLGLGTALLGPTLGDLAKVLAISLPMAGAVRTGRQAGQFVASVGCAWLGSRRPSAHLGLAGFLCYCAGLLLLLVDGGLALAVAAAVLWGLGQGGLHVVCNAEVVSRTGADAPRHLATLHFWYSLGSIAGPLLVYLCRLTGHWALAYLLSAGTMALLAVRLFRRPATGSSVPGPRPNLRLDYRVLAAPMLAVTSANMINAGLADWTYQNSVLLAHASAGQATVVTSAFWVAIALGRWLSARLVDLLGTGALLLASAAVTTVGTGGIVLFGAHVPGLTVATTIAGLGIAPLYPLLTALGAGAAADTTSAAGVLSAGAAAAAAIGPLAQGLIGNGHDGGMIFAAALSLPLVVGVVLTVRQDRVRKTTRPTAAA